MSIVNCKICGKTVGVVGIVEEMGEFVCNRCKDAHENAPGGKNGKK